MYHRAGEVGRAASLHFLANGLRLERFLGHSEWQLVIQVAIKKTLVKDRAGIRRFELGSRFFAACAKNRPQSVSLSAALGALEECNQKTLIHREREL